MWRRHFPQQPKTPVTNQDFLLWGVSKLLLHLTHPTKADFLKLFWQKSPLIFWINTALCVVAIRKGKHVPTCSASNNGSSQERASLVEWRKINSLQRQFKCHRSFVHAFFHKYQIGKHCQHQKNPHHRMNSNRNCRISSLWILFHSSLLKWEKNKIRSNSSVASGWFTHG